MIHKSFDAHPECVAINLLFLFLFLLISEASRAGDLCLGCYTDILSSVQFHYWNFASRLGTQKRLLLLSGRQALRAAIAAWFIVAKPHRILVPLKMNGNQKRVVHIATLFGITAESQIFCPRLQQARCEQGLNLHISLSALSVCGQTCDMCHHDTAQVNVCLLSVM